MSTIEVELKKRDELELGDVVCGLSWDGSGRRDKLVGLTVRREAPDLPQKPGAYGTATVRGLPNVRVMRLDAIPEPWATPISVRGRYRHADANLTDFVPLDAIREVTANEVENVIRRSFESDGGGTYRRAAKAVVAFLAGAK